MVGAMRQQLPTARAAIKQTYAVRLLQAPRRKSREIAAMIKNAGGEPPPQMKPEVIAVFHVEANGFHQARVALEKRLREENREVRSVNRGLREFVVYISHPEDRVRNVARDSG